MCGGRGLPAGRLEDQAECMLVLIGATPEGRKELVGFQTGVRESAQSWRELLVDVKRRGLKIRARYCRRRWRARFVESARRGRPGRQSGSSVNPADIQKRLEHFRGGASHRLRYAAHAPPIGIGRYRLHAFRTRKRWRSAYAAAGCPDRLRPRT